MHILTLLRASNPEALREALVVTGVAGLANATLVGLINMAADNAAAMRPLDVRTAMLYAIAAATYQIANNASLRSANALMQERLAELRLRLADGVRRADLRTLEHLGEGRIYAVMAQETNYLAQNFPLLVASAQGVILVLFCLAYIAWLSQISFVTLGFAAVLGVVYFLTRRAGLDREMIAVHARETAMVESLSHFADGFQEIRLNAARSNALYARFREIVAKLETAVTRVGRDWVTLMLFGNAYLYGLLGVVVFVLPIFFAGYTDTIYKIAAAAIFCVGPVLNAFSTSHLYARAEIGLGHVFALVDDLAQAGGDGRVLTTASRFSDFQTIALRDVVFRYEEGGFSTGPWSLAIQRGELVYLRGGNGAGKSTALKLLCGLYRPQSGAVLVDDAAVEDAALLDYRELFSAIFTDFHLFSGASGLEDADPQEVRALIGDMGLSGKVDFVDGRFSTLDLSTGQRKRLAMIVALLEDRPVYVFDEWAADQDAHFRAVFYETLLPRLKARGKTLIVVSHDERFWDSGDRVLTLDVGEMSEGATGALRRTPGAAS